MQDWGEVARHARSLLLLSWANVLTFVVQLVIPTTSTFFLGHLSPKYMGAATIGNMIVNASGMSIGIGIALALDTLCSQANGAKKYKLVGLHCQRGMVLLSLACVPIFAFLLNTRSVLRLAKMDSETADLAALWVKIVLFGMWPSFMNECYKRYLNAMKIVWPQSLAVVLVSFIHVPNAYLLVHVFNLGFRGAAIAAAVSQWLIFLFTVSIALLRTRLLRARAASHNTNNKGSSSSYALVTLTETSASAEGSGDRAKTENLQFDEELPVLASSEGGLGGHVELNLDDLKELEDTDDPLDTWPALSGAIFRGWIDFLKLGLPTAVSLFVEWGSWEVNAFFSSRLGEIPLAAHSILALTSGFWYSPPLGISISASSLVGNALGANEPQTAKLITILTYFFSVGFAFLNGLAGIFYRYQWAGLYTGNAQVISLAGQSMFVMWLYTTVDALKCVGMAILRGCGRPVPTVWGNIFSTLLTGYPLSLLLGFYTQLSLFGIWLGMCFAWLCAGSIYLALLYRTDWQHEADLAAERNAKAVSSSKLIKDKDKDKDKEAGGKELEESLALTTSSATDELN